MKKQAGIALFVCLMILLVLSLLGISAMRMMTSQNMISSSSQGSDIAFDAAETSINKTILDAQTALTSAGTLPPVSIGVTKTYTVNADSKGVTKSEVSVSIPDDMGDKARRAMLEKITDAGSFPGKIEAKAYRFSATSGVDALDISTTHVQDTIVFVMN